MSSKSYPLRIPRYASGIRAQLVRSGSSRNWWHSKWLETVEPMGFGGRFARGRNYAISGQVVDFDILGACVSASVIGVRPEPYKVTLSFSQLAEDVRKRIVAKLRSEPMILARLLTGELPLHVERIFREENVPLFPAGKISPGKYDVTITCSCPDWVNPCKHSSAVLVILGEEISRRPLTLLELRGIKEEELFDEA